jgi:hypothetical protein
MKTSKVKLHTRAKKGKGNSTVRSHKRITPKSSSSSPVNSNPATVRKSLKTKKPASFKQQATDTLRDAVKVQPNYLGSKES